MKSVLIVEDEPIGALLLNKMLSKHFKCELADNSAKCKTLCREKQFDFVILDINLGTDSIDGLELLQYLKNLPQCKTTQFIAITAYAMPDDKERFLKMGFDFYFSKPIIYKTLINVLLSIGKDDTVRSDS